jgi:signal transduction histidine kinase
MSTFAPVLAAGGAAIAIATKAHHEALAQRPAIWDCPLSAAARQGRYIALDAEETRAACMVDGWPHEERFKTLIGTAIARAAFATGKKKPRIAAFGEMVALLCADGNPDAAIRMEQLWNELIASHSFTLLCGYPMARFENESQDRRFQLICAEHAHVIPAESYTALHSAESRRRTISLLQQKAARLDALTIENEGLTRKLNSAKSALLEAEKLAAAGRLASSVAHEINNPLEAVANFIYLARTNEEIPEQVRKQLEIADREIWRVAQIAQQTLGFYRNSSESAWVDVNEVLEGVLTIYERKMRAKQLNVHRRLGRGLRVRARHVELKQVLSNLIVNAIEASAGSGGIWVRTANARDWRKGGVSGVRIVIGDNGCGIDAESGSHIFEPFFTTKPEMGTGIGLWVTKSLIEKQGGYIQFRSRKGEKPGTVMSVFLPGVKEAPLSVAA